MSQTSSVGAAILAAGASTRFGQPKQLAIFRGKSLVEHAAATAISAGCTPVIIVAGDHANEIKTAVGALDCLVAPNPEWREGIASSIRSGLQHALAHDRDLTAILFLACDQPLVRPEDLRGLIELQRTTGKPIAASTYAETLGIPALFTREFFPDLLALSGDRGAKELIRAQREEVAVFPLPAGAIDIDTASDYQRLNVSA